MDIVISIQIRTVVEYKFVLLTICGNIIISLYLYHRMHEIDFYLKTVRLDRKRKTVSKHDRIL